MRASVLEWSDPFHLARRALRRGIGSFAGAMPGRVLDVGCGTKPYRNLFPGQDYVGIELNRESPLGSARRPDVYFDGLRFPVIDGAFEAVLCSQVLEHVFEPEHFLAEVRRVLAPNGRLLLTVPFVWDEHEQPFDYGRYTSFGLEHLLSKAGFRLLSHQRTLANGSILVQLWLASVEKRIRNWPRAARMLVRLGVVLPSNLAGMMIDKLSGGGSDLYLDNVALFERTDA